LISSFRMIAQIWLAEIWLALFPGSLHIAYDVSMVSQFMYSPREPHMEAIYRILCYLKSSPGKGLLFSRHDRYKIKDYTNAYWVGSIIDRWSTAGYCTSMGGNLVTWHSKKQSVVTRSNAEVKFRALAHEVCETLWLKIILKELEFDSKDPMRLYCDNKVAISIAHNPV
jgi:hypothetical protein